MNITFDVSKLFEESISNVMLTITGEIEDSNFTINENVDASLSVHSTLYI